MDLDIQFLGQKLSEFSFLVPVLEGLSSDKEANRFYGRVSLERQSEIVTRLLLLLR